jgi:2-hydroxy-4-carboxymuconate semialdehyde hemiacetal dehydrogenase
VQKETGLVCMVGHTRRFNPSHQWVHNKIEAGELTMQQMDVQTYFFRRSNINALGRAAQLDRPPAVAPRRAHRRPVPYQSGQEIVEGQRGQGPMHPELGIAMDMSIQLKAPTAARSARSR